MSKKRKADRTYIRRYVEPEPTAGGRCPANPAARMPDETTGWALRRSARRPTPPFPASDLNRGAQLPLAAVPFTSAIAPSLAGSKQAGLCGGARASSGSSGSQVCVPEIADYELRRGYIARDAQTQTRKLDELVSDVAEYVPITTDTMRRAADLLAELRRSGQSTADPKELDVDVVLAAQAHKFYAAGRRIVVTTNIGHLSRLHVEALLRRCAGKI